MAKLQHDGHVITPKIRTKKDDSGRSALNLNFQQEGITQASTGTFACEEHDRIAFSMIDDVLMNFEDYRVLDLLFFRALLKEAWTLLITQRGIDYQETKGPLPIAPSTHPRVRLESVLETIQRVSPFIDGQNCPILRHVVRYIRTEIPVLAASCAGGGLTIAQDRYTGKVLTTNEARKSLEFEPNSVYTFTVIPRPDCHAVVASYLGGSVSESYFNHIRKLNGKELEAAISSELILFGENWFLNPRVWSAYGAKKQGAIVSAYNNINELTSGNYKWWDKGEKLAWYEYLNIRNRHQLNLFRYDKSSLYLTEAL